jgi:hypothetical protein
VNSTGSQGANTMGTMCAQQQNEPLPELSEEKSSLFEYGVS